MEPHLRILCQTGFALLLFLLASCENKPSAYDLGITEYERILAIYRGEDVAAAERALLSYRQQLDEAEAKGVKGIRFDAARGLVDARLFLIYERQGSPKADQLFPKVAEHVNREGVYGGQAPTNFTRESLLKEVELLDRNLNVKWKDSLSEGKGGQ